MVPFKIKNDITEFKAVVFGFAEKLEGVGMFPSKCSSMNFCQ